MRGPEHRERRCGEHRQGVDGDQRSAGRKDQRGDRGRRGADAGRPDEHSLAWKAVGESGSEWGKHERRRHAREGDDAHGGRAAIAEGDDAERDHEGPLGGPGGAERELGAEQVWVPRGLGESSSRVCEPLLHAFHPRRSRSARPDIPQTTR